MNGLLKLNIPINLNQMPELEMEQSTREEIAIIGISVHLPMAQNTEELWNIIAGGKDSFRKFPNSRKKDIEAYLTSIGQPISNVKYTVGSYFDRIDAFDYEFNKITKQEAKLMDPNQRLFLQCAYHALEDAGYGGNSVVGTRTGVYVGFTQRGEYQSYISNATPELMHLAEAGNLSSIIPSRISYILDLKGPSMLVDTACSSSLTAVHLACQALRAKECDMALAGGVKISIFPVDTREKLDIESKNKMIRAFDDASDGTIFGEGCATVLLKPLSTAIVDRDSIYAVIKGSSLNQDGAAIGITAPNVLAQEDVLTRAWEEADIDPETLTYIEAHGTGTKLGDPIEINAITKAFERYTNKKQFCAVGSIKNNIGHLDNTSGIAGLIKGALVLKHKKIPPMIHFQTPNKKINFEDSPVYINNKLCDWEKGDTPRRCGISSFGLSGTNSHMVLEEAPVQTEESIPQNSDKHQIFTISSNRKDGCITLIKKYISFFQENNDFSLQDVCFTVCTGRGHYNYRIAIIADSMKNLLEKLQLLDQQGIETDHQLGIFVAEHWLVPAFKEELKQNEIRETDLKCMSVEVNHMIENSIKKKEDITYSELEKICSFYINGADADWFSFYAGNCCTRVHLPGYPFEEKRCWVEIKTNPEPLSLTNHNKILHPLIDACLTESNTQDVYLSFFNEDRHWVLKEHRFMGKGLLPGTAYLEIAKECSKKYFKTEKIEFKDVIFIAPLIVEKGETKQVLTVIDKEDDYISFTVEEEASSSDTGINRIKFCEGKVYPVYKEECTALNIDKLTQRCSQVVQKEGAEKEEGLEFGPRWNNLVQRIQKGEDEVLTELCLPDEFSNDINEYDLHPSLLDVAVNAVTQDTGYGLYLPLSYASFKIYKPMPKKVFSYIRRSKDGNSGIETFSFDVTLFDDKGDVIGEARKFTIKKVHGRAVNSKSSILSAVNTYGFVYTESEKLKVPSTYINGDILYFKNLSHESEQLVQCLKESGRRVVEIEWMKECSLKDYIALLSKPELRNITQIIHGVTFLTQLEVKTLDELKSSQKRGYYDLLLLVKALADVKKREDIEIIVISDNVYTVTGKEEKTNPQNAPQFGVGKVINTEFNNINCRCLDIDELTDMSLVSYEINHAADGYYAAYRQNHRYIEIIKEIELKKAGEDSELFQETGVCIITGGLGGIGYELIQFLVKIKKINIVVIGRRNKNLVSEEIERIQTLTASFNYYSCDVSDDKTMKFILDEVRSQFGKINCIIHTAGMPGNGYIINRPFEKMEEVIKPKVYGTWLLEQLTEEDNPQIINFSSVSSIYGNPGQGDYTAANSYLDAFSDFRNKYGRQTITVNWAPWKEKGMAYNYGVKDNGIFKMLTTEEGIAAFNAILNSNLTRVIIGNINKDFDFSFIESSGIHLSNRIFTSHKRNIITPISVVHTDMPEKTLVLKGRMNDNYSPTERNIAKAWSAVLDEKEIDIYSNFNDIGGDSILATQLLKEIDVIYPGIMDISSIFSYPFVSEMAEFIDKAKVSKGMIQVEHKKVSVSANVILNQLATGKINIEDADRMLKELGL